MEHGDGVFLRAMILASVCDDIISSAGCAHVSDDVRVSPKRGWVGFTFPPNSYNRVYNTITHIVVKCVLKEVQNFIKIYKTLGRCTNAQMQCILSSPSPPP